MPRPDLNDLLWFLAVAEERSFTRAAARIGVAQSTLSHRIMRLETRMGLPLLHRTTRSVAPTEAGARLMASLSPRMAEIEAEIESLSELRDSPAGTVRLTLSDHAFDWLVWPRLSPVLARHPDLRVEFFLDNGFRDIVGEGFDAGIRLGESVEKDMVAMRIGPDWRLVVVASPAYFGAHPAPDHPETLIGHRCINHRHQATGGTYAWEFEKDGRALRVRVEGPLAYNTSRPMVDAALNGHGLAFIPEDLARPHLEAGTLVQALDDWTPAFEGYHIYYPDRRRTLPAFRTVLDALRYRGR